MSLMFLGHCVFFKHVSAMEKQRSGMLKNWLYLNRRVLVKRTQKKVFLHLKVVCVHFCPYQSIKHDNTFANIKKTCLVHILVSPEKTKQF